MKILKIIKYDLIKMVRDKTSLLFIVLLPLIFTFVMGMLYGNNGTSDSLPRAVIGIVNKDRGYLSSKLLYEIGKDKLIKVEKLNEKEIYDKVRDSKIEAGFIIPDRFTQKIKNGLAVEIKVLKLPSSAGFIIAENAINNILAKLNFKRAVLKYFDEKKLAKLNKDLKEKILTDISLNIERSLENQLITVKREIYNSGNKNIRFDGRTQSSVGMMVMFVMFTIVFSAGTILEERKNHTWDRLAIAPVSAVLIYSGKILGIFLKGWIQVIILMLFGAFVIGVPWGNSMFATIVVMSIYLFTVTGFGLFLSSIVKTNSQLGAYSSVVIICTSMLGGCYWPIEFVSQYMQKIAKFMPQYWAVKALRSTIAGASINQVVLPMVILFVMGMLFFLSSVFSGKLKLKL